MSFRLPDGTVVLAQQPDDKCELCGKIDELRPYGEGFARICYECAMKDKEGTKKRMAQVLYGEDS